MTKQIDEQDFKVADIPREVKARLQTAADADAEMSRKARSELKKIDALEIALPKEQALLEPMKKDCRELQVTIRARDSKAASENEAELLEAVKSGKIGVVQFHEQMTEHKRKTKTEAETVDNEIAESMATVRAKAFQVLQMENELWEAKANYYYLLGHPTDQALGEIGKMVKELSFRSQMIHGHYMTAQTEQTKFRERLDRAKGKALVPGWNADNLTIDEVRALVFLPEIPEKYLPSLASVILEIEANEKKLLEANTTPGGKQRYLGQEGRYYMACSFQFGLTRPWTWICRNENQKIQMSEVSQNAGITMSDIKTKGKIEGA
ncbi:MAG: hypothetical protein MUP71_11630 [Candidatus Aminicenantes bacterium]|nr:hypothetical protein [Candidatus Aminicenantes bacterium]